MNTAIKSIKMRHLAAALGIFCGGLMSSATANELYFQMNPSVSTDTAEVYIFGVAGSKGTLTSADGAVNKSFTLNAQGFLVQSAKRTDGTLLELSENLVQKNGFSIKSDVSNDKFSAYFLSRSEADSGMAHLIDSSKLGTSYVVAAYTGASEKGQISAQATQGNTTVTFKVVGGATVTKTLNAGQTYMFTQDGDVTGSTVTADKPIAVFSGNKCATIGNSYPCDHIVEQMPSIDRLSKTYYVAPTARTGPGTGSPGDIVRIVASKEGATVVNVDGNPTCTLSGVGKFCEIPVPVGKTITSNKPVLVAQYLIEQDSPSSDPSMTIVPGADQWLNSYVYATPSGSAALGTDYISLLMKTADLATLALNNSLVGPAVTNTFIGLAGGLSYGNIDVSGKEDPFLITAKNPFQLLLSGYKDRDGVSYEASYFTYGGAAWRVFDPGNNVPEPGTFALLALGLLGVAGLRHRKSL